MKTLTMVMRSGVKGSQPSQLLYTLIADDYSIVRMHGNELVNSIASKKLVVTNLGVDAKGLVSTNGAMDKYTFIDFATNKIEGKASPVVLNRVEVNGKLVGYTIFTVEGTLLDIPVAYAVKMHTATPFANGKLRQTLDGYMIQSIEGNYPIRTVEIPKNTVGQTKIDLVFIGSAISINRRATKYAGVIISCDNAADISKIHSRIEDESIQLVNEVVSIAKDSSVKESLELKRTGTAGFYTVLPIELVLSLIKEAGNKVHNMIGSVMVSCVDYSDGAIESRVTLSTDLKPLGKETGTPRSEKFLKGYLEEILLALKNVKIEA